MKLITHIGRKALFFHLAPVLILWVLIYPPDFFVLISLQALALQLGIGWLVAVGFFPFFKKSSYMLTHLLGLLCLFLYLKPYVIVKDRSFQETKKPTFTALHLNVHGRNKQHQRLVDQLLRQNADLITLVEVNHRWATVLSQGLQPTYPYCFIYPVDNAFSGMAVFSKHPLEGVRYILNDEPPTVVGNMCLPQGKVRFISTHTSAPILQGRISRRYQQLDKLSKEIYHYQHLPVLLLGDFNAVPWERLIRDFKQTTQMQDTRNSLTVTFPTWAPWLGIPIDYIFYSPKLICKGLTTFRHTGSDHMGLVGEFGWYDGS